MVGFMELFSSSYNLTVPHDGVTVRDLSP